MQESKQCRKCGECKPLADFGNDKTRSDGKFPYCKPCKQAGGRADHAKHKAERHVKAKLRYAANPEPQKKRARAQYYKDPAAKIEYASAWSAANKPKVDGYKYKYYKANVQTTVRESVRRRYARVKGAKTVVFTKAQLDARMAYWGNRCWVCKGPFDSVDHVKPLAKGGAHMLCNLRPICRVCNSRKRDTWPL